MSDNPFITIRYLDDNRTVEEQCEALSPLIESGVAVPMEQSSAVYADWAKAHGKTVKVIAPKAAPKVEAAPEVAEETGDDQVEPKTTEEPEPEEEAPGDPPKADGDETPPAEEADEYAGLPEGYTARQYGSWHVAYDPDGKKIGKGRKSPADAVSAARKHAGLE